MKIILRKLMLAAGFASGLGVVAAAFAQTDGASTPPPPTPPAATAPADVHSVAKTRPEGGWRGRCRRLAHHRWLRRLARRLGLDTAQRAQLVHIHAKAMAGIWAARADDTLTKDQRRERIKATVEAGRADLNGILTPDQREKLELIELRQQRALLGL